MTTSAPPPNLNAAESALWEAFPQGVPVDLRDRPERTVRAQVVAALLRGARAVEPGGSPAVALTGAEITGVLDLNCATVAFPLRLQECGFDSVPDFSGASTRTVWIVGSELPGFDGRLMRIEGDLNLRGTTVRGRLTLVRATIAGELILRGATLINPGDFALFAGGMVVESAVLANHSENTPQALTVEGCVRISGAQVHGGLVLDGVQLSNPAGMAMEADNLHVFGRMLCGSGFRADGRLRLAGARIDGELKFSGATLTSDGIALTLTNAVVEDLNLRPATRIQGLVDLRHTRCTVLRDRLDGWPEAVALDGFTYEAIDSADLGARERLQWLGREQDGYRPQPYEQLAGLFRRLGADSDARVVLLGKQRARRRELRPPFRLVGYLLDWTVGYGYKPWLAFLWLTVLLAIGTSVFSVTPPLPEGSGRHFDAVMYTLDLLLPISAFGLREEFAPAGATRWVAYGLTAAGWLLATALIAGVTRALRRD